LGQASRRQFLDRKREYRLERSASSAIFLILELSQPFTGLMMISSEPLRNALGPLDL
jgi:hypothetical protein